MEIDKRENFSDMEDDSPMVSYFIFFFLLIFCYFVSFLVLLCFKLNLKFRRKKKYPEELLIFSHRTKITWNI